MRAADYIKQFTTDNPTGMISYESIIELMEGYAKVYHEKEVKKISSNVPVSGQLQPDDDPFTLDDSWFEEEDKREVGL